MRTVAPVYTSSVALQFGCVDGVVVSEGVARCRLVHRQGAGVELPVSACGCLFDEEEDNV